MNPEDWDSLRTQSRSIAGEFAGDCRSGPFESDYTYFSADIDIDGESAANIGIRKKGFIGSQSEEKPGFRINLDEYVDDTKLFCTDNITLNNSVQDPALFRQCLSYKVFRDAGLAAPRCNFARVSMNGEDLGIYVNIEPVKKKFLRENFGDDEGDLYEGTITDFTSTWHTTFEPKTDETDATLGHIRELVDDLESSSEDLETVLRRHFDLDQLLTFLSLEAWVGHWDGYGGNQNNFFIYRDTDSKKFGFIPWGADGTMDPWQIDDEEGWFPKQGYIAQRILRDETLATHWYDRIGELRGTAWNAEALLAEVDRFTALLNEEGGMAPEEAHLEELRYFIEEREDSIKSLLPVTYIDEFSNPFCMVEHGFIEADFSTIWTDTRPDALETVFEAGDANIRLNWEGFDIDFNEEGSIAAPVEDGYGNVVLAGGFDGENGPAYVVPVFYFEVDALEDGLDVDLDWGEGSLLYIDETTGWEPVEIGAFWGGTARLDTASPVEGAEVTGTISSGIYTWVEYSG